MSAGCQMPQEDETKQLRQKVEDLLAHAEQDACIVQNQEEKIKQLQHAGDALAATATGGLHGFDEALDNWRIIRGEWPSSIAEIDMLRKENEILRTVISEDNRANRMTALYESAIEQVERLKWQVMHAFYCPVAKCSICAEIEKEFE
jgi:hypothetical protein